MSAKHRLTSSPGKPLPLGATPNKHGTQFALFSRHARGVTLIVYEPGDGSEPLAEFELDHHTNRTGDIWHIRVDGVEAGHTYLYRVDGPFRPEDGHRYDPEARLLDPYAKALTGSFQRENGRVSTKASWPRCVVVENHFDWQGDRPLNYPLRFSVIYETHVRGLTAHPSSGVEHPGTFQGVIEKIPYFKELGVTSLELLPVQEFDELENTRTNPVSGQRLHNFWGYSTIAFFAPKGGYSSTGSTGQQVDEFKRMVRELHKAGIEVILDVVFNHTAESDETGSTLSFRGLDNAIYYILDDDRRFYKNYTGCGNTLNCNHPTVRTLILDCLHYWVVEMHVDGFRFDLGSVLGRDSSGRLLENPPILERIAEDPILRHTKIIAEAWDAAGAYQVGLFPGGRWAEWNDRFRDDVRRFWRGDAGLVSSFATRLTGSSDLYLRDGRKPFHSINFVTSHDGFTLYDLLSYQRKHNLENGQDGRDGLDENLSSNYGTEGETADGAINAIRQRQTKNFLATLILSFGTPMLLGGDEFGRTQRGNNNAWCQDNAISWYDWELVERNADLFRFCRELIAFRARHPALHRPEFYNGRDTDHNTIPDITWYDERGDDVDWTATGRILALRIDGSKAEIAADRDDNDFFMIFNASPSDETVAVCPAPGGRRWHLAVDTGLAGPGDFYPKGSQPLLEPQDCYKAMSRSVVVLLSR